MVGRFFEYTEQGFKPRLPAQFGLTLLELLPDVSKLLNAPSPGTGLSYSDWRKEVSVFFFFFFFFNLYCIQAI